MFIWISIFEFVSNFDIRISDFSLPHNSLPNIMIQSTVYILLFYCPLVPDPSVLNIGSRESDSPESEHLRIITYEIIRKICKTKPISKKSSFHKVLYYKDLRKLDNWSNRKTKPIQSQFKANFRKAAMNLTFYLTKDYSNEQRTMNNERLCKTNPIQSQFMP